MGYSNNYRAAVALSGELFAVQFPDRKWGIANGPGTVLSDPRETIRIGQHLPVLFDTQEQAMAAARSAPQKGFDPDRLSPLVCHCLHCGAVRMQP